jgi:hypothetical protein
LQLKLTFSDGNTQFVGKAQRVGLGRGGAPAYQRLNAIPLFVVPLHLLFFLSSVPVFNKR